MKMGHIISKLRYESGYSQVELAEKIGITKGAVITGIEGTTVDGMDALQEQLQYYKAGEKVKITVQTQSKNGEYEKKDVEVTLGKQSE